MNKKLLIAILTLVMACIMIACGTKAPAVDTPVADAPAQVQTDAPEVPDATEATQAPTEEDTNPDEPDPFAQNHPTLPAESTESTEPTTEPKDDPAPTEPDSTQEPTTGGNTGGNTQTPTPTVSDYEAYIAMSGEQQQAFIAQFESVGDFVNWYNDAKAKYEAEHPEIEIGPDTVIDGSQLGKS